jgi:hypothetical protein
MSRILSLRYQNIYSVGTTSRSKIYRLHYFPLQKLSKSKACADTGLLDTNLFQRCLQFYSAASEFLLKTMTGRQEFIFY